MKDIVVAVACYKNEKEVIKFAENLSKQSASERIQLLVTCNACSDIQSFKGEIKKQFSSVEVYDPGKNLGYLPGCLYGVNKTGVPYSWVMVSNTDIEFQGNDFFEKVLKDVPEDVWCVGPDITLSHNGTHQNPFMMERPSKRKAWIWKTVYSNYCLFWLYFKIYDLKKKKLIDKEPLSSFVYAVHGSCFFLHRDCLNIIMDQANNIFMYGEELLVSEIIREYKKKCYFNATACITHNENQVTGAIAGRNKQKWFKQSINYLYSGLISD